MKLLILTVGRPKEGRLAALAQDYLNRIRPPGLAAAEHAPDVPSRSPEEAMEREGQELLRRLRPRDRVVLLMEEGPTHSSRDFAALLSREMERAEGRLVFIIGGPWGTGRALRDRADLGLSLSPMTFTHEMCFLFLAEQLYRALSILQGTGYHH